MRNIGYWGIGVSLVLISSLAQAENGPFVPGFERFERAKATQTAHGGRLLAGELGCRNCHQSGKENSATLAKQAPDLRQVAVRVDPFFLVDFISEPHRTLPGTTMPRMLNQVSGDQRRQQIEAIVHYLVSLAKQEHRKQVLDLARVMRGEKLYHESGCIACHVPERDDAKTVAAKLLATSRRFPDMARKYSFDGLRQFLRDPLRIRPSGRMPHLHLSDREAGDIAQYLLRKTQLPGALQYKLYYGRRRNLADRERLRLERSGMVDGFKLSMPRRRSDFTVIYDGFLRVTESGSYTFEIEVDDAVRLVVDNQELVKVDSERASRRIRREKKTIALKAGLVPVQLEYFQRRDDTRLDLRWSGPGVQRTTIPPASLTSSREQIHPPRRWKLDTQQATLGKRLFAEIGCVQCHQVPDVPTSKSFTAWSKLDANQAMSCLAPGKSQPQYSLDEQQISAIKKALEFQPQSKPKLAEKIHQRLNQLNCYACHERNKLGGPEETRREFFTANAKDLGDEGRLPPTLTGVGDKLKPKWLDQVLQTHAVARPYMNTRMPFFGESNLVELATDLVSLDRKAEQVAKSGDAADVAKHVGRTLVDKGRLQCIACHTFNRHPSIGIQAMDLVTMPDRLNRDWFHRYMRNPARFRPGTRMPQMWPQNRSFFKELDGDVSRQIDAIWTYLSDGRKAVYPKGLNRQSVELIVGGEAVVYRNKIRSAGFRGICVGYPEQVNLAVDAERMRLAQIWQGRFLNVSAHWNVQSMGRIGPIGHSVIDFPKTVALASLKDAETSWPDDEESRPDNLKFRGYQLDKKRRPAFLYDFEGVQINDFFAGRESENKPSIKRTLTLRSGSDSKTIWFLVWRGDKVTALGKQRYDCGSLQIQVNATSTKPVLRKQNGMELLVPIKFTEGKATLEIEYLWE